MMRMKGPTSRAIVMMLGILLVAGLGWVLIKSLGPSLKPSPNDDGAPPTVTTAPELVAQELSEQQLRSAWAYVPAYEALQAGAILASAQSKAEFIKRATTPATSFDGFLNEVMKFIEDNKDKMQPADLRAATIACIKTKLTDRKYMSLLMGVASALGRTTTITSPGGFDKYVQNLADMLIENQIPKTPGSPDFRLIQEVIREAGAQFSMRHAAAIDELFSKLR